MLLVIVLLITLLKRIVREYCYFKDKRLIKIGKNSLKLNSYSKVEMMKNMFINII